MAPGFRGRYTFSPGVSVDSSGNVSLQGQLDMNDNRIVNLATPVADADGATKQYVDAAVAAAVWHFFLTDSIADISSYYYMYDEETSDALAELTTAQLSAGDDQLLWSFVTESGFPSVDTLSLGVYTGTFFFRKSGNKTVNIYWKLFTRDTNGVETLILTSELSDDLTTDRMQYILSAFLNQDVSINPTDRIVLKFYANVSGVGTNPTVTISMQGNYDSRIAIRVESSAFSNIFVRKDGDSMAGSLTVDGDVGVGSTTGPTAGGGKVLYFGDNGGNPTMATDTAGLFAKDVGGTVEMFAIDESNTAQQLTSVPEDEWYDEKLLGGVYIPAGVVKINPVVGLRQEIDLVALAAAVEKLTGKKIIRITKLPVDDCVEWNEKERGKPEPEWIKAVRRNMRKVYFSGNPKAPRRRWRRLMLCAITRNRIPCFGEERHSWWKRLLRFFMDR